MGIRIGALVTALMIPTVAYADEKGQAIVKDAFAKLGAAKSMTASMTSTMPAAPGRMVTLQGSVAAMKPNLLRVNLKGGNLSFYFVADGKAYYSNLGPPPNMYVKNPLPAKPVEFIGMWEGEIDGFFGGAASASKVEATYTGSEKVGGVDCEVVTVKMAGPPERTVIYAIGKSDRLIRRAAVTLTNRNGQAITQTNVLTNIRLNVPLKQADFAIRAPAGSREMKPPPRNDVIRI